MSTANPVNWQASQRRSGEERRPRQSEKVNAGPGNFLELVSSFDGFFHMKFGALCHRTPPPGCRFGSTRTGFLSDCILDQLRDSATQTHVGSTTFASTFGSLWCLGAWFAGSEPFIDPATSQAKGQSDTVQDRDMPFWGSPKRYTWARQ